MVSYHTTSQWKSHDRLPLLESSLRGGLHNKILQHKTSLASLCPIRDTRPSPPRSYSFLQQHHSATECEGQTSTKKYLTITYILQTVDSHTLHDYQTLDT